MMTPGEHPIRIPLAILALSILPLAAAVAGSSPPDQDAACGAEIEQLHAFFAAWYRGELADTDEDFSRLVDVIADDFQLITTGGFVVGREQLLPMLRSEYGTKPDLVMRAENIRLRLVEGDLRLLTYEEHGEAGGRRKASLITAVLRRAAGKPNGLEWVHLHEVAMPLAD